MSETVALADLAMAAFCPRKLYYARRTDRSPPPVHDAAMAVSRGYAAILEGASLPDIVPEWPTIDHEATARSIREGLETQRERLDRWNALTDPTATDRFLAGKDVHGQVAKVLEEPLAPTIVTPGEPPPEGVWQPQAVRAVGAAKALAWERSAPVDHAYVEYPLHGTIRRVALTTRRKSTYRRTLRAVESMDGPPPRLGTEAKCQTCRFAEQCGVRTRSLRSLL